MPTHKAGSIVKTKNGRYAKVLANGRWKFISAAEAGRKGKKPAAKGRRKKGKKPKEEEEEVEEE